MNLGFGLAQRFEDADRGCLRRGVDRGLFDDRANFRQAATVYVIVPRLLVRGCMGMLMTTVVIVSMIGVLFPENFPRQVFLAVGVDIDFGC